MKTGVYKMTSVRRMALWIIAITGFLLFLCGYILFNKVQGVQEMNRAMWYFGTLCVVITVLGIVILLILFREEHRKREFTGLPTQNSSVAEADFEAQRQYAENLSHELLTPLAILNSKIELLLQTANLTEDQLQHVDAMVLTLNRLSRTNRGLILLSKMDNGLYVDREEILLSDLLQDVLEGFEDPIRQKQLKIRVEVQPGITLMTNPTLLEIMVANLMKNAIQHNIEGGEITITLDNEGLVIVNTGVESEHSPDQLLGRFVSESSSEGNVGLGLSIVQKICNTLGYELKYAQENGRHTLSVKF